MQVLAASRNWKKNSINLLNLIKLPALLSPFQYLTVIDAFKLMKQLSGRSSYPSKIFWKDCSAETVEEKANLFNLFFKSVFRKTGNAMLQHYCGNSDIFLSAIVIETTKICLEMKKMLPGSFANCDDIPFVWSSCAEFLVTHVHQLFSHSSETCEWPEFWKCAFVTPIHKKLYNKCCTPRQGSWSPSTPLVYR